MKRKFEENMLGLHHAFRSSKNWGACDAMPVSGNAEGVLAGKAKGLKLLSEIVSELD